MRENYIKSLIYLGHSFALADGIRDDKEREVIRLMRSIEDIDDDLFHQIDNELSALSKKSILLNGVNFLQQCEKPQILKVFAWLFRILDADDCLKVNEVRIMLFVLKHFDISFDQVIKASRRLPKLRKK